MLGGWSLLFTLGCTVLDLSNVSAKSKALRCPGVAASRIFVQLELAGGLNKRLAQSTYIPLDIWLVGATSGYLGRIGLPRCPCGQGVACKGPPVPAYLPQPGQGRLRALRSAQVVC